MGSSTGTGGSFPENTDGDTRPGCSPFPQHSACFPSILQSWRESIFRAVCLEESRQPGQRSRSEAWGQDASHGALLLLVIVLLHKMRWILEPSHSRSKNMEHGEMVRKWMDLFRGPGSHHWATVPSLRSTPTDCWAIRDSGRCCPVCS